MTHHAIIVGGGIVGLACAIRLQERGISTLLIERDSPLRGASWGNAGHVAVEQVNPLASMETVRSFPRRLFWRGGALALPLRDVARWLPFSLRLLAAARPTRFAAGQTALKTLLAEAMPAWRRIDALCEGPKRLIEDGHFIVWENEARARAGRAAWLGADCGTARFRDATPDELAMLARFIPRPIAGAIYCEGSGHIADPTRLEEDLRAAFLAVGGMAMQGYVEALPFADGRVAVQLTDGRRFDADHVVIATGAASDGLLRPLGHHVPLIAERGYHVQAPVSQADWPVETPPIVFEDRSMIVTRFEKDLRAASIVEFSSLRSPPDPRKWRRLRRHVAALGLPIGRDAARWIGARPTLPDYLPAIGRSDRATNLLYAFGHQHLGLTLGPISGEIIAALVTGAAPPVDPTPFSLRRFEG
ncbi:FAD-binding oxidoreductase [Sphingobium sp. BYY-5]|uniref:NAD(P)/FAD-dependent oxidoreductase n=1 Tax=Sphingobium sp. BYY-5 TaxID=2926400 RepID=UPI001FA71382|nr:FAD-binding oxidoreductase [Sphingobium sp. BYY-5]MCI4591833.1 FAD-binding oxidoreductase [Sphingobium sp. BYY-5]